MRKRIIAALSLCCALCFLFAIGCGKPAATISSVNSTASLYVGEGKEVEITTENYDGEITWKSSNTSIVTVRAVKGDDKKATVTAVGAGSATVTATLADANEETKTDISVTVSAAELYTKADMTVDQLKNLGSDSTEIVVPADINVSGISEIWYNGNKLGITSKDDAANTVTVSEGTGSFTIGAERALVKLSDGDAYNIDLVYASSVLYTYEDFMSFIESIALFPTDYIAFGANIDLKGQDLTQYTGYASAIAAGTTITIDGRGYALVNAAYTHGITAVFKGYFRNISVLNSIKATNGGGLLFNESYGDLDDVFVYGDITASGNGVTGTDRASIDNSIFVVNDVTNTADAALVGQTGYVAHTASSLAQGEYNNIYAISNRTKMLGNDSGELDENVFASVDAFKAANLDLTYFELGFWSLKNGVPVLTRSLDAIKFNWELENVPNGAVVASNFAHATVALKSPVTGITVAENGAVSYSDDVADGTEFTLVATTPEGLFSVEKTFKAQNGTVSSTSVRVIAELGDDSNVEIPLTEMDATLTPADVTAVMIETTPIAYTSQEGKLVFNSNVLTANGEHDATLYSTKGTFSFKVYVADFIIRTKEDFTEYNSRFTQLMLAGKYVFLGNDVDAEGLQIGTAPNNATMANAAAHTFDGLGHTITNLDAQFGICGIEFSGVCKNVALIDCKTSVNVNRGVICQKLKGNGVVENVYCKNMTFGGAYCGFVMALDSADAVVRNCVIVQENTANCSPALVTGHAAGAGSGKIQNVYGISATITDFHDAAQIITVEGGHIFADAAALNADATVAQTLSAASSLWNVKNGQLYFGNVLVG